MLKSQESPSTTEKNNSGKSKRQIVWERNIAQLSRWLHIYVSMISFAIVFFFAVTGLTLNHPDFFAGEMKSSNEKGKLDLNWVNNTDTAKIAKLEIVEHLRKTLGIKAALAEFRIDDAQCSLSFKGPGYAADAFIDRTSGDYEVALMQAGFVGVMNDLHKGRDSGSGWSVLIDVSAILMTLVSLTGIILIFYIKRKRVSGLVIAAIGLILAWLVWAIWVK
ncbi:MAG: PepSY-associated TM helix domain-containing protein [Lacibacter sp.]